MFLLWWRLTSHLWCLDFVRDFFKSTVSLEYWIILDWLCLVSHVSKFMFHGFGSWHFVSPTWPHNCSLVETMFLTHVTLSLSLSLSLSLLRTWPLRSSFSSFRVSILSLCLLLATTFFVFFFYFFIFLFFNLFRFQFFSFHSFV